jgi:hypothetical protein
VDTNKENEYIFNEIDELKHFVNLRAKNAHQTVDQYILEMFDKDPGSLDGAFEKPYASISKEAQSQRRSVLESALKGF